MIEVIYTPVAPCPYDTDEECTDYYSDVADDMQEKSFKIFYGYMGILASSLFGSIILFWGFGVASERMNKRVRDAVFANLVCQEIGWFDVRSVGTLASRLEDDAAMLNAFAGEPIRTLSLSVASVVLGVVVSARFFLQIIDNPASHESSLPDLICVHVVRSSVPSFGVGVRTMIDTLYFFRRPFALLCLGIIPFLAFGAEMEMAMYLGEDEADVETAHQSSPGGILLETLANMRTVASLTLENKRAAEFSQALYDESPHALLSHVKKGMWDSIVEIIPYHFTDSYTSLLPI